MGGVRLQPSHSIAYERIIGEALPSANLTLAGSPTGFAVRGPNESRNRLRLDTALEVDLSDRATIDLSNSGVISTDRSDVSGNAVFKIRF